MDTEGADDATFRVGSGDESSCVAGGATISACTDVGCGLGGGAVGASVRGVDVGFWVGCPVGCSVVGCSVGVSVGVSVVGCSVGFWVGCSVLGCIVGLRVGGLVGRSVMYA